MGSPTPDNSLWQTQLPHGPIPQPHYGNPGYGNPGNGNPSGNPHKLGAIAWTATILGIVGIAGSWVPIFNNLTAIAAFVGIILGVVALFGTRKGLAFIGIALSILAIVFTVMAQQALGDELDKSFDNFKTEMENSRPTFDAPIG